MPASTPQDIRNIVLLGHGGSGKTTIAEGLLHAARVTTRLGSVDEGTSGLDFSDIEKERGHSVDPAVAFFEHEGKSVNIVDAPGYPDFVGGAIRRWPARTWAWWSSRRPRESRSTRGGCSRSRRTTSWPWRSSSTRSTARTST